MKVKDTTNLNGRICYEGPSSIDGKPVMMIMTGFKRRSQNDKTGGGLLQTWILRSDIPPSEAVKTGEDKSICGDCRHRGTWIIVNSVWKFINTCYVKVYHAPRAVFECYKNGKGYRKLSKSDLSNEAMDTLGYCHQWRTCDQRFRDICMASVDTIEEQIEAQKMGWRTFRVRTAESELLPLENMCPASHEAGRRIQCDTCKACSGLRVVAQKSTERGVRFGSYGDPAAIPFEVWEYILGGHKELQIPKIIRASKGLRTGHVAIISHGAQAGSFSGD